MSSWQADIGIATCSGIAVAERAAEIVLAEDNHVTLVRFLCPQLTLASRSHAVDAGYGCQWPELACFSACRALKGMLKHNAKGKPWDDIDSDIP